MTMPVVPHSSVLSAALEYAARGWRVLPLPIRGNGEDRDGKAPALSTWQKEASCDPAVIAAWWQQWPAANVGVLCDPSFGFAVDIDDMEIIAFLPDLPKTLTGRTPSGGCHLIYRHPDVPLGNDVASIRAIAKAAGWVPQKDARGKLRGLDIRGKAGQIVVHPSRSPRTGEHWRWVDESEPIADAPQWLIDALQSKPAAPTQPLPLASSWGQVDRYTERAIDEVARDLAGTVEGTRGGRLFWAAARLGELGVSHSDAELVLVHACVSNGLVAKDGEASVRRELRRGWDQGASNPVEKPAMVTAPREKPRAKLQPVEAPVRVDEKGDPVKSRDSVKWVKLTDKGAPVSCRENVEVMLAHYRTRARYNVMTHEDEYEIEGYAGAADKRANVGIAQIREWARWHGLAAGEQLFNQLELIIADNHYHPAAEWIRSREWDGVKRVDALFATLSLATDDLMRVALARAILVAWLASAAQAALVPANAREGIAAQLVLVLQGPQAAFKTRWIERLVPHGSGLLRPGVMLDPSNRDSVQRATSTWIVELGELDATIRKSDIASLKAYLTNRTDTYRAAYARTHETIARRTVYAASVNERGVLHDDTGNRRLAMVSINQCDCEHDIDMQQLWAEVATWPASTMFLSHEDEVALTVSNRDHEAADPIAESLAQTWQLDESGTSWRSLRQVCEGIDMHRQWSAADSKAVARALRNRMRARSRVKDGYTVYAVVRRDQ